MIVENYPFEKRDEQRCKKERASQSPPKSMQRQIFTRPYGGGKSGDIAH